MRIETEEYMTIQRREEVRAEARKLRKQFLRYKEAKETRYIAKKYFRLQDAADLFSIGISKTRELAEEADAVYKVDGMVLINIELFEAHLETFRVWK